MIPAEIQNVLCGLRNAACVQTPPPPPVRRMWGVNRLHSCIKLRRYQGLDVQIWRLMTPLGFQIITRKIGML